jgi:16S rRNA (cytosine1402-N4)-methyltransferase
VPEDRSSGLVYAKPAFSLEYFPFIQPPPYGGPGLQRPLSGPGPGAEPRKVTTDPHRPVLVKEALEWLNPRPAGVYCDATVGYGGHAQAILEASAPDGRLVGMDRDPQALEQTASRLRDRGDRLTLVHAPFSRIKEVLGAAGALPLDGCLVDLGVSSPQLDRAERGFSFSRSGPLDMRMDPTTGETAAEYLRRAGEEELASVLHELGEERYARRIARAIVEARRQEDLSTTGALAALVARSVPRREHHKDPATRTFQALRMAVNRELPELERLLADVPGCLRPGGRLVIIAFHSLEDRMVKHRMRELAFQPRNDRGGPLGTPAWRVLTKKPVTPSEAEVAENPRARSAKLRVAERMPA